MSGAGVALKFRRINLMEKEHKASKNSNDFFWSENFENFSTEKAQKYDYGVNQYAFNRELYDPMLIELLQPYVSGEKLKILDAGGGTGKWSIYFAKMGHDVELLDIAEPMLAIATENIAKEKCSDKVNIVKASIDALPYDDDIFDFVFSDRNPISHCGKKENAYTAISELYRVLKPKGHIFGCVLNRYRKIAQLTMELEFDKALKLFEEGHMQRSDLNYTYYFGLEELKNKLYDVGFTDCIVIPTTALTEFIPTAWLLDSIPLKKLYALESAARNVPDMASFGVRFHFIAKKG